MLLLYFLAKSFSPIERNVGTRLAVECNDGVLLDVAKNMLPPNKVFVLIQSIAATKLSCWDIYYPCINGFASLGYSTF